MNTCINREDRVPQVSIGMPVYNDERFIRDALDSLLGQTFTDFELIVSDNASTDRTPEICQEYVAKDRRIRYIRQLQNKGQSGNFNLLFQEARGEYFMWAASDDRWDKRFIQTLLDTLISDDRYVTAFCPYSFMDEDGRLIGQPRVFDYSSRTRLGHLLKLCWHYDDGAFYGIHKRLRIKKTMVPTWWGVNSKTPYNIAYPVLFYFFSVGDFVLTDSPPLWFNRLKRSLIHFVPGAGNSVRLYLCFGLRKANVLYESVKNVHWGSKSFGLVLLILPALLVRLFFDILTPPVIFILRRFNQLFGRVKR